MNNINTHIISENVFFDALLRENFSSFVAKVFNTLNPTITYQHNWHIDLISEYLKGLKDSEFNHLIINLPPRSMKSIISSVAFPAWLMGLDPSIRIIAASYTQNLSIKHSLDTKFILNSNWFQRIFPKTILSVKHNCKSKYLTTLNGFRMSVSVGGMVTGEGGDYLIIDDPHNPSHIYSEKRRNKVLEWYEQTFSSRLNSKKKGKILIIMQRLHFSDLVGYLTLKDKSWEVLKIPAQAPQNIYYNIGNKQYFLGQDKVFEPNRFDKNILSQIRDEMGKINYAAQYMQDPIKEYSSILNYSDIYYFDANSLKANFEYYIASWDTAVKAGIRNDYSVCSIWGKINENYYLIYLYRDKLTYPELKKKAVYYNNKYGVRWNLIEDHASGSELISDLKSDGMSNIIGIRQNKDKITRFAAVTGMFQSGVVQFPKDTYFMELVVNELVNFPFAKNDDIVDSISQFLNFIKNKKSIGYRIRAL